MKYLYVLILSAALLFSLAACNTDNKNGENNGNEQPNLEEDNDEMEEDINEPDNNNETEKENNSGNEIEEPTYQEEVIPSSGYVIYSNRIYHDDGNGIPTLNIERSDDELGEGLRKSLVESDVTSQNVLSALQEVTIENETEASFNFSSDEQMASMASTEQLIFGEMISQISSLYGIELIHLYVEDEPGLSWGQSGELETIEVESEENRGYYLFPADEEGYTYISGASAGEEIRNENEELFDFSETLEAMGTVTAENVDRQPGISELIDIHDATISENKAEVNYAIAEGQETEWTEEDKNHFENILQLTALDFQVNELHLINETENTITIFPFGNNDFEQ